MKLTWIGILGCLLSVLMVTLIASCASRPPKPVEVQGPVTLRLKGEVGERNVTEYHSHARIRTFEKWQLLSEKDEVVDFLVEEWVTGRGPNTIDIMAKTIKKNGPVDLRDMAFPELNEEIVYKFTDTAEVKAADPYPPGSLFFIPPVSLPKGAVQVGDTWTLEQAWVSLATQLPMALEMTSILKRVVRCGRDETLCADLELSGSAKILVPLRSAVKPQFQSLMWGRILFSIDRGSVVWSSMRSREVMPTEDGQIEVISCMASSWLDSPLSAKSWRPDGSKRTTCEPGLGVVRLE